MARTIEIAIIGTGNVATNLAYNFKDASAIRTNIYGRNEKKAEEIAKEFKIRSSDNMKELCERCEVIVLCTTDDSMEDIAKGLKKYKGSVVHTSGALGLEILSSLGIEKCGVFYPLQSLTKSDPISFRQVPLFLEGNNKITIETLRYVADMISEIVTETDSESRAYLHLAAVFANNFTNQLYVIASEIVEKRNLSFEMLRPLIAHTADKVMDHEPVSQQTGPALRHDHKTMKRHRELLSDTDLIALYDQFTRRIQNLKTGSIE